MLEDAGVPSGLYNWEPQRGAENSMWDELIPPLFIQRPVWRCFLISASVCAQRSGSIHLSGWVGAGGGMWAKKMRGKGWAFWICNKLFCKTATTSVHASICIDCFHLLPVSAWALKLLWLPHRNMLVYLFGFIWPCDELATCPRCYPAFALWETAGSGSSKPLHPWVQENAGIKNGWMDDVLTSTCYHSQMMFQYFLEHFNYCCVFFLLYWFGSKMAFSDALLF